MSPVARVLLFGRLGDLAGWRERLVDEVGSLAALRERLARDDLALGAALAGPGVLTAVDRVMARDDLALTAASEVAFMPPMSGG